MYNDIIVCNQFEYSDGNDLSRCHPEMVRKWYMMFVIRLQSVIV